MRMRNTRQLFWVDETPINQPNTMEQNHRVQLMRQIYTRAASVAVWLGEADPSAESDLAMDFVERKGSALLQAKGDGFKPLWTRPQAKAVLALRKELLEVDLDSSGDHTYEELDNILWWQELPPAEQ
ncbi:hypothetical protein AOQ84DRAFT_426624, partial [Glonium stellatum]